MSGLDILEKLQDIKAETLGPLQRILLVTDGTLTEILEAYFLERIQLIKLSMEIIPASPSYMALTPRSEEKVMGRKILLRGAKSGTVYVYAESTIAFESLGEGLRRELLESEIPLGRLWLEYRLETFKEFLNCRQRPASTLARYFNCLESTPLLERQYRVLTNGKPVMLISEYFPAG